MVPPVAISSKGFNLPKGKIESRVNSEELYQWCTAESETRAHFNKPLIMAVLNITPDSFSDGGLALDPSAAQEKAISFIEQGADLIDIGGESTKPGATPVSCEEELQRVIPVITGIRRFSDICISIDTSKPEVMQAAAETGASMINDVRALTSPGALSMAAHLKLPICLMHMKGDPETMQQNPEYLDVVDEINNYFIERIDACVKAGIPRELLILDPGFGFGKTVKHNMQLIKRLKEFQYHYRPLLLGASRKTTIGAILNKMPSERLVGGLTLAVFAALQGINIIRTHDVEETKQALNMLDAIVQVN
jgi:dihydropteroate synthase